MFPFRLLGLLLLVLLGSASGSQDLGTQPSTAESLLWRSFSITTIRHHVSCNYSKILEEYYSKSQGRAKIVDIVDDYYYSLRDAKLLRYNARGESNIATTCEQEQLVGFYGSKLGFKDPFKSFLDNALNNRARNQQHVVGLARLIPLIASHADDMTFVSRDTEVLNYETEKFVLNIKQGDSSKEHITFEVHYPSLHGAQVDPASAIPARIIVLQRPDGEHEDIFAIDFRSLKFTQEDEIQADTGEVIARDLFALPLGVQCSKSLERQAVIPSDYLVASFKASLVGKPGTAAKSMFVAIDSRQDTLIRVDRLAGGDSNHPTRTNLYDWSNNHHYLIVQKQNLECVSMSQYAGDKHPDTRNPIFGSNEFAYMGVAQQNGAQLQVYEAPIRNDPVWLAQPELIKLNETHYIDRNFGFAIQTERGIPPDSHHDIVVYIASNASHPGPFPLSPQVTLIEIYRDSRLVEQLDIYEFEQALNVAPNGDKGSKLFSLAPCFKLKQSHPDQSEEQMAFFKTIDILFELSAPPTGPYKWLNDADKRNDAILNIFDVSPAMLGTVESVLVHNSTGVVHLLAKLETLPYIRRLHELQFNGIDKIDESSAYFMYSAESPAECIFELDRSLSANILELYYDQKRLLCFAATRFTRLVQASSEAGELFSVTYLNDTTMESRYARFHSQNWRLSDQRQLSYRGEASLGANIKHYKRSQTADEGSEDYGQTERSSHAGVNLDIESKTYKIWRISRTENGTNNNGTKPDDIVSLDKCKAACLDNPTCHSFSYCQYTTNFDCLLTEANTEYGNIQSQLDAKQIWKMRHNEKLQVNLTDGKQLDLVHNGKCELHRKTFIDLFEHAEEVETRSIYSFNITGTRSREQCAELCFTRSLQVMTDLNSYNENIWSKLTDETSSNSANDIKEIREIHRKKWSDFCHEFHYLDDTISVDERLQLATILGIDADDKTKAGLCAIRAVGGKGPHPGQYTFKFATHGFDFSSLFEKRYDYILDSSLTSDEQQAFDRATKTDLLPSDQLELVKKALKARKNYRLALDGYVTPVECAAECFKQTLWPVCRSFDFIRKTTRSSLCYLNTANLTSPDAVQVDQIRPHPNILERYHYETRFKLLMFNQDVTAEIEVDSESNKDKSGGNIWTLMIKLVTICVGIVCGVIYAPKLATRIEPLIGLSQPHSPDVSSLLYNVELGRDEESQNATGASQP